MSQHRVLSPKSLAGVIIAGITALTCAVPASAQRAEIPAPAPAELTTISGTLHLYGCDVGADAIELRALPVTIVKTDVQRRAGDGRAADLRTRLLPTATPYVYRFSFRGVVPGAPYKLGIRLHPLDACGTVIWRAPLDGVVFGGSPRVALEGFAVTTTVEVRDVDGDWVSADEFQLDQRTGGVRTFRWRSTLSSVVGGELKVSLSPFPMEPLPLPCADPDGGVIHRERLTLRAGEPEQVVSLDIGALLDGRRQDGRDAMALRTFSVGAPLYVRIVPELPEGLGCDPEQHGIPGTTALARIPGGSLPPTEPPPLPPVIPGNGHSYSPPYLGTPAEGRPTYGERGFKVIRPHTLPPFKCKTGSPEEIIYWLLTDPLGCHLIEVGATPGSTIQPGSWFWLAPVHKSSGSSDPLSGFVSSLKNLGEAFSAGAGLAVNGLSTAWEDIQNAVVKVVVDVITWVPGIGEACNHIASTGVATCDSIVKTSLQTGLMAMGIPPSIPNWEQLQEDGIDYLAAEMATQIESSTGLPSELSEAALKQIAKTALEKIEATRGAGAGPAYDWVIPYLGFEPAVLKVALWEVANAPIPTELSLVKHQDHLYGGAEIPMPKAFPSNNILRVPIVLQPRLDVFEAPLCRWFGNQVTCQAGSLWGTPLKAPMCQAFDLSQNKWITFNCGSDTAPAIYYRDRWRTERFSKLACARLQASMLLTGLFGIPFWSPEQSFTMSAWVKPWEFTVWDGATLPPCGM